MAKVKKLKPLTADETKKVESAFSNMGLSVKQTKNNPYIFLDDLDKCHQFCTLVLGEATIKKNHMSKAQCQPRAERIIRAWNQEDVPADLDVKKDRYVEPKQKKEKKAMPVGAAKKNQEKDVLDGFPFDKHFTKRGIIYTICTLLHKKPQSKQELLAELTKRFPEHTEGSLTTTIGINLSALQKRIGKRITKTKDPKRGTLYGF